MGLLSIGFRLCRNKLMPATSAKQPEIAKSSLASVLSEKGSFRLALRVNNMSDLRLMVSGLSSRTFGSPEAATILSASLVASDDHHSSMGGGEWENNSETTAKIAQTKQTAVPTRNVIFIFVAACAKPEFGCSTVVTDEVTTQQSIRREHLRKQ